MTMHGALLMKTKTISPCRLDDRVFLSLCVSIMAHGFSAEEDTAYPAYPADRRVKAHTTASVCANHWSPSMGELLEGSDPAAEEAC